ncbi:MAG: recombinase family protein [Clostridiales bacterium]|nr:recombinase family protein [Clostridiales bacterium]
MKVFYIRCSTEEQNEARQEEMARANGAERIYKDKASGKNTDRTDFKKMMEFVRDGDTVITESISRIARNTKDLLNIVEELQGKGVNFISLKEAIDTTTPQGKFMLTVFAAMAQLERENILQRQAEGIAIAKAEGKYKGRKPKDIDTDKFKKACKEWRAGERTAVSIQKAFSITGTTFYRWVKEMQL